MNSSSSRKTKTVIIKTKKQANEAIDKYSDWLYHGTTFYFQEMHRGQWLYTYGVEGTNIELVWHDDKCSDMTLYNDMPLAVLFEHLPDEED